jgi:hypothetical protein
LEYASETIRDDLEIVELAIGRNGSSFKYASERLKDDYNLAILAIRFNSSMFHCISERLRCDPNIIKHFKECDFNQNCCWGTSRC